MRLEKGGGPCGGRRPLRLVRWRGKRGSGDVGADTHEVEIAVPAGTCDLVTVESTAKIAFAGREHALALARDRRGSRRQRLRRAGEGGSGAREAGVWYSHSTDARTDIWPWIAAGDPGRVAVAWFGNDEALPGNDAELAGTSDGWNVYVAQMATGLGYPKSPNPGFRVTRATPQAFHVGTICMGGTVCRAELVGRRLGDYFT